MLAASVLAGLLWDSFGSALTFIAGAAFSALAIAAILFGPRWSGGAPRGAR